MRSLSLAVVFAAVSSLATFGCAAGVDSDLPTGDSKPGEASAQGSGSGCDMLDGRCIAATAKSSDQDEVGKPDIIAHAAASNGIAPEAALKLRAVGPAYQIDNPAPRDWVGQWQKGNEAASNANAHFVLEGSQVSGRLVFGGSSCFAGTMQVKATHAGQNLTGTATVGDTTVEIVAVAGQKDLVTGQFFLDGKYTVISGACAGDRGTFLMAR